MSENGYYQKHLFFCVNLKQSGKKCCAQANANEAFLYAKRRLQSMELHAKGLHRVNSAGCLGRCSEGPTLVVYPDGVWYRYASIKDIDEIIDRHIIQGEIVTHLLMVPANDGNTNV